MGISYSNNDKGQFDEKGRVTQGSYSVNEIEYGYNTVYDLLFSGGIGVCFLSRGANGLYYLHIQDISSGSELGGNGSGTFTVDGGDVIDWGDRYVSTPYRLYSPADGTTLSTNMPIFDETSPTYADDIAAYRDTGKYDNALNKNALDSVKCETIIYVDESTPPNIYITWDTQASKIPEHIHIKIMNTPVYGNPDSTEVLVNQLITFTEGQVAYTWGALENLGVSSVNSISVETNFYGTTDNICTAYISNEKGRFTPTTVTESIDGYNSIVVKQGIPKDDAGYNSPDDESEGTDDQTVVNTANLLTTTYKLTETQLQALGNFLWGDSFFDNIKLLNNSPIENIVSVKAIPAVFVGSETANVVCGNVDTGVSGVKITNNYIKKTIGSIKVAKWYSNFIDYEDSQILLYLPLIGQITDLDAKEVMGYKITLKYCFDVITGDVLAMIFNDRGNAENIIGVYRGNCGIDIPLTSSNRAQVEAGYISDAISGISAIATKNPLGVVNAGMSALTRQNTSHSTGSVSGVTAQGLPNKAYLTIITPVAQNYGKNFNHTYGRVCCKGVSKLKSLSGFTKVDSSIDLSSISCTETEKEELRSILANGFYM